VISSAINISYLTGFRGSAGLLIQNGESHILLVDGRYLTLAHECRDRGDIALVSIEKVEKSYDATLAEVLGRLGASHIWFESDHVTVSALNRWQEAMPGDWRGAAGLVEDLRLIKDAAEIAILRRAGAALMEVASRLREWVAADRRERDVAADINRGIERAGFERPAFDTIVASGPNSAHPHARPGDRRLADGDLVVLDFGGVLDGYCVDLTRMAAVGRLRDDAGRIYRAVQDAQQAALNVIRAGVTAGAVDAAARQVLDGQGLGAAFVHGTGHGLGLEVHEAPRLSSVAGAEVVLRAGMVCTIEPGAYVPGVGGARLEDDVLVTDTGAELLTPGPRDLLTV
jgi:Xaa-Pro aminopeptidase